PCRAFPAEPPRLKEGTSVAWGPPRSEDGMVASRAAWFLVAAGCAGCASSAGGSSGGAPFACGDGKCKVGEVCVTTSQAGCPDPGVGTGSCSTITSSSCEPMPAQCASTPACGCVERWVCP